ncbi:MAG: OsmC family protein [Bacteroidales bacterium]|nr:OsmC family protein [Bacteroidales bacterium]MCF8327979.1 OsmC family protein [Bacteroidales bacterium]
MMEKLAQTNWKDGMAFDAEVNGHKLTIDADEKVGGKDRGPRPKPLLAVSLAGCTSMDVISILKKMRVTPDFFDVEVFADSTEEHPKHYNKIHLKYIFKGKDLPEDKINKAVNLSQDRYCGVSHMLGKAAELTHEIVIEES